MSTTLLWNHLDQEPGAYDVDHQWTELLNRWLTLEDGVDAIKDKIAVEQLINA